MEQIYYLLVFSNAHAALSAERSLMSRLPVRVVPTLRQISASCGISLRVEEGDYSELALALGQGAVEAGAYRLYRVEGPQVRELKIEGGAKQDVTD